MYGCSIAVLQVTYVSKRNELTDANEIVCLSDNSICEVKGRGTVHIRRYINNEWLDGQIDDVMYVPSLRKNLLSTGVCAQKGYKLHFENDNVFMYKNNALGAYGKRESNNSYRMVF